MERSTFKTIDKHFQWGKCLKSDQGYIPAQAHQAMESMLYNMRFKICWMINNVAGLMYLMNNEHQMVWYFQNVLNRQPAADEM